MWHYHLKRTTLPKCVEHSWQSTYESHLKSNFAHFSFWLLVTLWGRFSRTMFDCIIWPYIMEISSLLLNVLRYDESALPKWGKRNNWIFLIKFWNRSSWHTYSTCHSTVCSADNVMGVRSISLHIGRRLSSE